MVRVMMGRVLILSVAAAVVVGVVTQVVMKERMRLPVMVALEGGLVVMAAPAVVMAVVAMVVVVASVTTSAVMERVAAMEAPMTAATAAVAIKTPRMPMGRTMVMAPATTAVLLVVLMEGVLVVAMVGVVTPAEVQPLQQPQQQ
jgi:hypothetical protein